MTGKDGLLLRQAGPCLEDPARGADGTGPFDHCNFIEIADEFSAPRPGVVNVLLNGFRL